MGSMINVSDAPVTVTIAGAPGSKPMRVTVEPGKSAEFADGYTDMVKGAGRTNLDPILSRETKRGGVPALVPEDMAEQGRARWVAVHGGEKATPLPPAPKTAVAEPVPPEEDSLVDDDLEAATTPKVRKRRRKAED